MKIFFLNSRESALANPNSHILDSVKAELLRRPGVLEISDAQAADAIIVNEPWAFREWRYIDKLLADPVVGRFPHKTYTINPDDSGAGLLRGIYVCLQAKSFDSRFHAAVPYVMEHNQLVLDRAGASRPPPGYLATFRGNTASNEKLRTRIVQLGGKVQEIHAESSESWLNHGHSEKLRYVELLLSGKFALCPGGWGPATFRIYESMALGVAPVIIADEYIAPNGPNWQDFSLRIPEKDVGNLERELTKHEHRYLEMGQRALEAWTRHFKPDRLFSYYCDELLKCIKSGANHDSAAAEIERWRSPKMYWANQWSMPQRLTNRVRRMFV